VPPPQIRRLRDVTRYRIDLVGVRTAEKQRVEKLLEDALLTELRGEFSQFRGQITMCVVTVSARDRSRGCSAGSVVVGGVAAWVA
jgi:hypothetical protein